MKPGSRLASLGDMLPESEESDADEAKEPEDDGDEEYGDDELGVAEECIAAVKSGDAKEFLRTLKSLCG